MSRPLLLGHRGARARKSIPENTFASFDQALADGCDGFEFDVRLAACGTPVICHDPQVGGLEVSQSTAEQLALPQLQEVLVRYQEKAFLDVELKVGGLERTIMELLTKHQPRRGFVVSSFLPEVIETVDRIDNRVSLGLIADTREELAAWKKLPIEYVFPNYKLTDAELIRRLKNANKKVFIWTVNSAPEMKRLAAMGVDGIISDNTSLLCRTLS